VAAVHQRSGSVMATHARGAVGHMGGHTRTGAMTEQEKKTAAKQAEEMATAQFPLCACLLLSHREPAVRQQAAALVARASDIAATRGQLVDGGGGLLLPLLLDVLSSR
jgi:hypothetical protein